MRSVRQTMRNQPEKDNAPEVAATGASSVDTQLITEGSNMSNSIALTIGATSVRLVDGLYSLNDLHKEAGGRPGHRPGYFLENEQTNALVTEIETAGIPAVKTKQGRGGGTYACKELVIAYAAWISAAFHLKVIRVFLGAMHPAVPAGNIAIDYVRINAAQAQALKEHVQRVVEAGIQTFGETWARLHKKFRVNSYLELSAEKFEEACGYLEGKLPQRGAYHFPLATADVHDRFCANSWLTPKRLLDPMNRAPELELIAQLEKDGHDVTGAKIRIIAMRDAMCQVEDTRAMLQRVHDRLGPILENCKVGLMQHGKNVLFSGNPCASNPTDSRVYRNQLSAA